jgi:hypothetical protein
VNGDHRVTMVPRRCDEPRGGGRGRLRCFVIPAGRRRGTGPRARVRSLENRIYLMLRKCITDKGRDRPGRSERAPCLFGHTVFLGLRDDKPARERCFGERNLAPCFAALHGLYKSRAVLVQLIDHRCFGDDRIVDESGPRARVCALPREDSE